MIALTLGLAGGALLWLLWSGARSAACRHCGALMAPHTTHRCPVTGRTRLAR